MIPRSELVTVHHTAHHEGWLGSRWSSFMRHPNIISKTYEGNQWDKETKSSIDFKHQFISPIGTRILTFSQHTIWHFLLKLQKLSSWWFSGWITYLSLLDSLISTLVDLDGSMSATFLIGIIGETNFFNFTNILLFGLNFFFGQFRSWNMNVWIIRSERVLPVKVFEIYAEHHFDQFVV